MEARRGIRRWLIRPEIDDELPDWYAPFKDLVNAARYLGVAPWDLNRAPRFWKEMALIAMHAEREAAEWHRANAAEANAKKTPFG